MSKLTTQLFSDQPLDGKPFHVVVGYDFSVASAAAFSEALRLAWAHDGRVSVVHVTEPSLIKKIDPMPSSGRQDEEKRLRESLSIECDNAAATLFASMSDAADHERPEVTYHLAHGSVQEQLLAFCDENDAELLVIGQHGATWLKRLVVGNRAANLLHSCELPLLTVAPDANPLVIERMLVAVDFSPVSRRAMHAALSMARLYGAELHVLHVGGSLIDKLSAGDECEVRSREALERFLDGFSLDGVESSLHVKLGPPIEQILASAEEVRCDLMVLGSVGRDGFRKWLQGNTAEAVAQKLHCSLLTVRDRKR